MVCNKELDSGIVSTFCTIVKTEMDYKSKTSKATVYYYLNEQAFLDGKESVMGEVIEIPFAEQEELKKTDITAKTVAEKVMNKKLESV